MYTADVPSGVRLVGNKNGACYEVWLSPEEWQACHDASVGDKFWGNSKPGAYGKGLCGTEGDPYKPARTGLIGQYAFAKLFRQNADLEYRKGGDSYDAMLGDAKVDIKCATRDRGEGLVQKTNEFGVENPQALSKDIYVFCYIKSEDIEKKEARVAFVGFAFRWDIAQCKVTDGYRGKGHKNYVVPYSGLKTIASLLRHYRIAKQ